MADAPAPTRPRPAVLDRHVGPLVIDMRWNGGGSERLSRRGALVLIIGRGRARANVADLFFAAYRRNADPALDAILAIPDHVPG
jgi:hypothetical protein